MCINNIQNIDCNIHREFKQGRQDMYLAVTLSSIGDGVISADVDGQITFMNSAAEELTGWEEKPNFKGG